MICVRVLVKLFVVDEKFCNLDVLAFGYLLWPTHVGPLHACSLLCVVIVSKFALMALNNCRTMEATKRNPQIFWIAQINTGKRIVPFDSRRTNHPSERMRPKAERIKAVIY